MSIKQSSGFSALIILALLVLFALLVMRAKTPSVPTTASAQGKNADLSTSSSPGDLVTRVVDARLQHEERLAQVIWRSLIADGESDGIVPLTLINYSGAEALVKVVSLDRPGGYTTAIVPDGKRVTIECVAGRFFLKMRYRNLEGVFVYQKGDDFSLKPGSATEITLHKVAHGNYGSMSLPAADF